MGNGSHDIRSQFSVTGISRVPCDSVFLNLLPQTGTLKRPYDTTEGVKKVNEYGEIVMTYPEAPVVIEELPLRIDAVRPRGEIGVKILAQGGEVYANFRIFVCGNVDIRENDTLSMGTREYQILLIEEYYDSSKLHHKECWARRVDQL